MLIRSIKLNNYRNYCQYQTDFSNNLNIIIGKNGIGKTNILESIIVVSNAKSYRTNEDKNLIKKDEDYLKIELETEEDTYKVVINPKSKSLYINDNLVRRTSDFIGKFNAILFKPGDLELFTQSPSERRKLIDMEIGKISSNYLRNLIKYNSLLKDKNRLLKELETDNVLLSVIEESMCPPIKVIIEERERFFETINRYLSDIYNQISKEKNDIRIIYKKCCEVDEIVDAMQKAKEKDQYYHYTTFGPHHDDYYFMMGDYELNNIASQGQKRMAMIAFKFALIKYIKDQTGEIPVVLLDDILSELDRDNQERLLRIIPKNIQTIITNTDIDNLNINTEYKLIKLKEEQNV